MKILNKYTTNNIKKGVENPKLIKKETKRILDQTIRKQIFNIRYGTGTDIMKRDWDNLIILDACRYDTFNNTHTFDGKLDYIISKGSQSDEFCKKIFNQRELYDTVYVTANAYGAQIDEGVFHDKIVTFDEKNKVTANHSKNFDPEHVLDTALQANTAYPNKRIIVHFMQPHRPYFGPKAEQLRKNLRTEGVDFEHWKTIKERDSKESAIVGDLLDAAREGYITTDQLYEVYEENLELVLEKVSELNSEMEGKTIITSDHGELLGGVADYLTTRQFGHPRETYIEELRKVPWFVLSFDKRRTIVEEPPVESANIDKSELENQLKALGYK